MMMVDDTVEVDDGKVEVVMVAIMYQVILEIEIVVKDH